MNRFFLIIISLFFVFQETLAQSEITFSVEKVEKATDQIETKLYKEIIDHFSDSIEAYNKVNHNLADFGSHAFLGSMHKAYAEHRPFVISPDMIWLLICQGFTNHINFNKEEYRSLLVNFEDKKTLEVYNDSIILGDSSSPWVSIFPEFSKQISNEVSPELLEIFSADFTTTSLDNKIVFQITLMDAMEPYFEYSVMRAICGIPEITIQGTTKDWNELIKKTKQLSEYKLDWWISELLPILEEISQTTENKINKKFWQKMFKIHTSKNYGSLKNIDGWIINFFPYDKNGNRINLKEIKGIDIEDIFKRLPNEIVTADFQYIEQDSKSHVVSKRPMIFWAGFVGAQQNLNSLALKPEIGWFISHKPMNNEKVKSEEYRTIIYNSVNRFPIELLELDTIYDLSIHFVNEINVPKEFSEIEIHRLSLNGEITDEYKKVLVSLFSRTRLWINEEYIEQQK